MLNFSQTIVKIKIMVKNLHKIIYKSLSYEKYLFDNFYIFKLRDIMWSEQIPYYKFSDIEELKLHAEETISKSYYVDILLIPKINRHPFCEMFIKEIT